MTLKKVVILNEVKDLDAIFDRLDSASSSAIESN